MRKIAAHYCLLPDGSLAKMPVISVDESGVIRDVKVSGDNFVERQGIELFGGVLIPGFIEDLRGVNFESDDSALSRTLNRLYAKGSLKYLCNSTLPVNFKGDIFNEMPIEKRDVLRALPKESVWEKIKKNSIISNEDIFKLINRHFKSIRAVVPEGLGWGVLQAGARPGVLLVKGLDNDGMKARENTTIKILVS